MLSAMMKMWSTDWYIHSREESGSFWLNQLYVYLMTSHFHPWVHSPKKFSYGPRRNKYKGDRSTAVVVGSYWIVYYWGTQLLKCDQSIFVIIVIAVIAVISLFAHLPFSLDCELFKGRYCILFIFVLRSSYTVKPITGAH